MSYTNINDTMINNTCVFFDDIQCVKEKISEIYLNHIYETKHTLCFLENQTSVTCITTGNIKGIVLHYVSEQIPDICLSNLKTYPSTLFFIKEQLYIWLPPLIIIILFLYIIFNRRCLRYVCLPFRKID